MSIRDGWGRDWEVSAAPTAGETRYTFNGIVITLADGKNPQRALYGAAPANSEKPPRVIPTVEFLDRFTAAELLAARTAQVLTPDIWLWLLRVSCAAEIELDADRHQAGVALLVSSGVLTQRRANEVLA